MKYSELKEKATQGEWRQVSDENYNRGRVNKVWTEQGPGCGCICDTTPHSIASEQDEANARLIVHQHEHFDKLLEALENLSQKTGVLLADLAISGGNVKESYVARAGRANFNAMNAIEAAQTVKEDA